MRKKRVALYDPYLDVMGGGENHILSILKVIEEAGYEPTIFWKENLTEAISTKLNLTFNALTFEDSPFSQKKKLRDKARLLKDYDIFIYVTDGSYFFSRAKKNYVFAMVPQKSLYNRSILNRLKTANYRFISNSLYTQKKIKQWGIKSEVIYPYINDEYINFDIKNIKKEKIILSVGRFFKHLHAKRQDKAIEYYISLSAKIKQMEEYKLVLAGNVKREDEPYFNELKEMAKGHNIELKPNIPYSELKELYAKAECYWHFAGYEVDESIHPEQVEHLGMTPLEAMAMGCIVFCYRAGGPKETIQDGKTGFLFDSQEELQKNMLLLNNDELRQTIMSEAKLYVSQHFSYPVFRSRVMEVFKLNT